MTADEASASPPEVTILFPCLNEAEAIGECVDRAREVAERAQLDAEVLVVAGGEVAGGLSISAPIERRRDEWIPLLKQAAKDISERLGYTGKGR